MDLIEAANVIESGGEPWEEALDIGVEALRLLVWAETNRFKFGPSNGYGGCADGWWYLAKDGRHKDAGTLFEALRAAKQAGTNLEHPETELDKRLKQIGL